MQNLNNKFEIVNMQPNNTTSVLLVRGGECVIFDPWGRAADWIKLLDDRGLKLAGIYATHGHPDHISAAPDLAKHYNIDWHMSHLDMGLLKWGNGLLEYFGLPIINDDFKQPTDLTDGTHAVINGVDMHVISVPGHTPGGYGNVVPRRRGDFGGRYTVPGQLWSHRFARREYRRFIQIYSQNLRNEFAR